MLNGLNDPTQANCPDGIWSAALRSPSGTISAGAELLLELDATPAQLRRLATNIYRAACRMQKLLSDAALPAAEKHGVQISNEVAGGIEMLLARFRMERVFFNLIINAVEAMPQGGKIRIGAKKTGNCVLVEVEDTGPGIPSGIRGRLFEPFVTARTEDWG